MTAVKRAMNKESDVLYRFEEKVKGHFDEVVANTIAAEAKQDALKQLKKVRVELD